jgi:hypothetical protein
MIFQSFVEKGEIIFQKIKNFMISYSHFFQQVTEIQGYSVAVPALSDAWGNNGYF